MSDIIQSLQAFLHAHAPIALFFMTFVQEDLSVITGGIFVANGILPWYLALGSLFCGIVASDLGIYGLGRLARKNQWIRSKIDSGKIEAAKAKLEKHLIPTVALCRTVPGFVFPTYMACGLSGIPFLLFATTTIIAAAIYVVILMSIAVFLGEAAARAFGEKIWIIPLTLFCLVLIFRIIPYLIKRSRKKHPVDLYALLPAIPETVGHGDPFEPHPARVSQSEKITPLLFYTPIVLQYLWLSLKYRSLTLQTAANPNIEAGGMWGESKSRLMRQIGTAQQQWVAQFSTLRKSESLENDLQTALAACKDSGLSFPLVAKPDIGWQGYGVRRVKDEESLKHYIESYPKDLSIILQRPAPWQFEAGVFYMRVPGEAHGRVISVTFRSIPCVKGDGKKSVRELIETDDRARFKSHLYLGEDLRHAGLSAELLASIPSVNERVYLSFIGSLRTGGEYRDGRRHITEALSNRFDDIARSMPDFHFGRFDIRFASVEALERGKDFLIFEINGAGSECIHIWDPDMPVKAAYKELFAYQRILFEIADCNRSRGVKPMPFFEIIGFTHTYNRLVHSYPPSE